MRKSINKQWWCYGAIFMMAVAFFLISRCGFLWSDDYAMGFGEVFALNQVLSNAKWFYFNWGGGVLCAACQYLFCGLLGEHKIWFDMMNTTVFVVLIFVCGKLIGGRKEEYYPQTLCFALLFWFLCPVPRETVFWMVGSMGYLWVTTVVFLFLALFFKYKDENFGFGGKLLLCLTSIVTAASVIPCVSICGAFVVYYLFRLKRFRGNAVPLVIGFAIGTLIIVLAPGNFVRAAAPDASYPFHVKLMELLRHPIREVLKFKALWLFVVFFLFGLKGNKQATMAWAKKNAILLLTLAWSIIVFSLVFRPANRALFFTETLSLILAIRFVKFALTTQVFKFPSSSKMGTVCCWINKRSRQVLAVLFALFVLDAGCAIWETITQHKNNDRILAGLKEAGGVDGVDVCISSHRMAYAPDYPDWSWEGIAYQIEVDSVHVYPYYCQDKYYINSPVGKEVYVDKEGLLNYVEEGRLNETGILFFRVPDVAKDSLHNHAVFTMEYDRPHKWYRKLMPNGENYQYARTAEVERDTCDVFCFGYDYYFVWMDRENIEGLKSVKYVFE